VKNSKRRAHSAPLIIAVCLSLLLAVVPRLPAQDTPPPAAAQVSESNGGFLSSLKQAFGEDFNNDVVRGHFDTGAAPNTRRYYCLVNPKSGKPAANGVSGEIYKRRDGQTGIRNAVTSPLSCADAERKGLLVTADYTLLGKAATVASAPAAAVPSAPVTPAPPAAAPAAAAPLVAPPVLAPPASAAPAVATTPAPVVAADGATQGEVLAVFGRFISGQNAHSRAAVADTLLDSGDFVLAQYRGDSIFGTHAALDAFEQSWRGPWKLDPQRQELRISPLAPGTALLITPLLLTEGPTTVPIRWAGVFVKARGGWRIGSICITPYNDWRPPR
jgi:hypothetical protein